MYVVKVDDELVIEVICDGVVVIFSDFEYL